MKLSVDEAIARLGGVSSVARELGLFRNAPAKWRQRGIPDRYVNQIAILLGVDPSDVPSRTPQPAMLQPPEHVVKERMIMTEYVQELYLSGPELETAMSECLELKTWDLTERQMCDIELLLNGAFNPLSGFLTKADYESVLTNNRLSGDVGPKDSLWPMPITLDVSAKFAQSLTDNERIVLRDPEGVAIAILTAQSIWEPDKKQEALSAFGSDDAVHPAVNYLYYVAGTHYIGGKLEGLNSPTHYDFSANRHTPNELRALFNKWGWRKVVAFQTRNPLHRAHQELTIRAARQAQANLLIHPIVGMTKAGDIDHFTRVRCYQAVLESYPDQTTTMSLLHLAMRMGGPREALWHALIRKNFGATHFIIGRDHAGPGKDSQGNDFYGPYEAQDFVQKYADEIGIDVIPFQMMVYVVDRAQYVPVDEVKEGEQTANISGTEVRRRLREDLAIPSWFSPPEVIRELKASHPPMSKRGFTVFFTGLSGSGKSTIANALMIKLMEMGDRPVTLLDGDVVRKNLSSELTFSEEHRNLNIQRIGYVASVITKNGGIAICAPIAPYSKTRAQIRESIEEFGVFIEIHVATPLEECERRDRKGLYAKARAGLIKGFTGIDDPYEEPEAPEMRLTTTDQSPDQCALDIVLKIKSNGLIS